MKNGWIKIFHGTYITGIDGEDISWSKTRMEGLRGVIVHHDGLKIDVVLGPGEYHYSEDYEVNMATNEQKLIARRVQFLGEDNMWKTWEMDLINKEIKESIVAEKI